MDYTIKRGNHYPRPFQCIGLKLFNKEKVFVMNKDIRFHEDCRYDIGKEDQSDVNKLMGFSWGNHHKESDRVGWRYLIGEDKIELTLYSYEEGKRVKKTLDKIGVDEWVNIRMEVRLGEKVRDIKVWINGKERSFQLKAPKKYWFTYNLGLYFGGNLTPPHDLHVSIL